MQYSWNGAQASQQMRSGAAEGLADAAELVLAASREVVPIEEATLSRSGATDVDPVGLKATISYDTVYAARQHEELTWRHDPGRTAKYLERPHARTADQQKQLIAQALEKKLR